MAKKASSSKRELIVTGTDKRYVRRDEDGRFEESDEVGRSPTERSWLFVAGGPGNF